MKVILGSLKYMCIAFLIIFVIIAGFVIAIWPSMLACYVESCGATKNTVLFVATLNFPWLGFIGYVAERLEI